MKFAFYKFINFIYYLIIQFIYFLLVKTTCYANFKVQQLYILALGFDPHKSVQKYLSLFIFMFIIHFVSFCFCYYLNQ